MRDQILTLAKRLITFPTTKDNTEAMQECLNFIAGELAKFNVISLAKEGSPSLLITNTDKKNPAQHFKYLLNGHIDVVDGGKELFTPQVKDGKLLGRGSADMKGPLAAQIIAFKNVAQNINYPLALQIVADEEIGGFNGTLHHIESGVSADLAIIGEKTHFNIEVAAKGVLWLELTTKGKTAHGAYLWEGQNAITAMNKNITAISQAFPAPEKEVWQTTCNISTITADGSVNQVPDTCTCVLDIRRVPEDRAEDIIATITDLCSDDTVVTVIFDEPAHLVDKHNEDIKRLRSVVADVRKSAPEFITEHGGSDARHFMHENIPAVCFGPVGGELHSKDEWVDVESLVEQARVLEEFLNN